MSKKISVIGSGSWGVALAYLLNGNGHDVKIWSYSQEEADMINNERRATTDVIQNTFTPEDVEIRETLYCLWIAE